jgi:cyanoexosortase B-associated protein
VVIFVLAIAACSALVSYFTTGWVWEKTPELAHLESLRTVQQQGLSLSDWQTVEQRGVEIGGHKWSYQLVIPPTKAETSLPQNVALLLRPQTWHRDFPQVDWMDINGVQGWTEDSQRLLQFTVPQRGVESRSVQVTARFFRGWNQERTYAVVQWYAWATGGSPIPSHWFWVDQGSQWLDRQRTLWVAVSLLFPIKPLGDIETARAQAEALGKLVQSALITNVLS